MIPAYDLETQQELLTDSNTYLGKTPLEMVKQFQTAFCGPVGFMSCGMMAKSLKVTSTKS